MIKIAPSILSGDFGSMRSSAQLAQKWGADYLHCDVMDGSYVPNITFGQQMIAELKRSVDLPLDVHLMVCNPDRCALSFVEAGADIVTFHPDACTHAHRLLGDIKKAGAKAGIVLNPGIAVCSVEYLLEMCDMVLLMSVNPGAGGQKFIAETIEKARKLSAIRSEKKLAFDIEIDGGVTVENAPQIIAAGVNVLVAGSSIYNAQDPADAILKIRG